MRAVPPALGRLAELVCERTGNIIPPTRLEFLEELALRRARHLGLPDMDSYVAGLAASEPPGEWRVLISMITVKESYFFRCPQQFEVLERELLPRLIQAHAARRRLRVWSVASARGEEPATLALVLAESPHLAGWEWEILATDLDEEALGVAARGLYGERAVSRVPPALLERRFRRRGMLYELQPELLERIRYQPLNLAALPKGLPEGSFDLVFLRNVLIYFPDLLKRRAVLLVASRLAADGYLFLGASETLWPLHSGLVAEDFDTCFAYRPAAAAEGDRRRRDRPVPGYRPVVWGPEPAAPPPAKIPPSPAVAAPEPLVAAPAAVLLEAVVEEEALLDLEPGVVTEWLGDAARALAESRPQEASRWLDEVLSAEPALPAAHALAGLIRDLEERPEEAVAAYRAALYLEPELFQVRLLLADCLRRSGQGRAARQHYREALTSLRSGRGRELSELSELPLPSRERVERRAKDVLRRG